MNRMTEIRRHMSLGIIAITSIGFVYGLLTLNGILAMGFLSLQYLNWFVSLILEKKVGNLNPIIQPSDSLVKKKEDIKRRISKNKERSYDSKDCCASCGEPLTIKEIKEGVTLCPNCELEETGTALVIGEDEEGGR